MRLLLDTNICIYLIKKKPAMVLARFEDFAPEELGVSSVTVGELAYGVQESQRVDQNADALKRFLAPLAIAEFGYEEAVAYGGIRAELERKGQPIGALDMLIAAHALSLDVALVTNNTREFSRVENLRLEDWAAE